MATMTNLSHAVRRTASVAAATLALGGCDLEVTNPGPLLDEALNTPGAMPALVNGMGGDLSNAMGNYLTRGSLAAFELNHSGNFASERQFAAGVIRPEDVNGDWARMHTARYVAEAGLDRMKTVLGTTFEANTNTPRAYLYAGFANRFLGENVCNAVYDGGPALPSSDHFVRAESLFTRALTLARAQNNATLTNAALAGRAQVYADQGKWTEAATDAAQVPLTFRHNAVFSTNTARENLDLAVQTITRREVTVWNTVWVADRDTRVAYDTVRTGTTLTRGQDGTTIFFRQRKYATIGDPVALAKGTEMVLIRAEAALRANDVAGAMTLINQGRTAASLAALTATTADAAWAQLMRERGAVLWLEGRRLFDLRRWLAEGRNTTLQGRSTCVPISLEERGANPNVGNAP
ncbi:MAG: RagB/SusD family nutrient uptake outer membrane protein [Gemmatimonadaceae bacterium]|nr:RagB/SusD family nutrient uptake outer membrane protein [Gemmatimonadaceae bacterium]